MNFNLKSPLLKLLLECNHPIHCLNRNLSVRNRASEQYKLLTRSEFSKGHTNLTSSPSPK